MATLRDTHLDLIILDEIEDDEEDQSHRPNHARPLGLSTQYKFLVKLDHHTIYCNGNRHLTYISFPVKRTKLSDCDCNECA